MTRINDRLLINKNQKSTPVILAILIVGFGLFGISHLSKSDAAPAGFLCASYGGGQCVSLPPSGTAISGEGLVIYSAGSAWRWYEVPKGNVTTSGPFNTGRLNNFYKGKPVVQFQLKANTDYCLANNGSFVVLDGCQDSSLQKWVISGNQVVNVSASDYYKENFVMTNVNAQVMTEPSGDYPANSQNWGWTTNITK